MRYTMMNMNYLIDSYAIIELVKGTNAGKVVRDLIEDPSAKLYISALSIYEVGTVLIRRYDQQMMQEVVRSLRNSYEIISVSSSISLQAIELKRSFRLPTVDCLIYATAKDLEATIVSGCKHFREIGNESDVLII